MKIPLPSKEYIKSQIPLAKENAAKEICKVINSNTVEIPNQLRRSVAYINKDNKFLIYKGCDLVVIIP